MKLKNKFSLLIAVLFVLLVLGLALWFMLKPQTYYIQGQVEAKQIRVAPKIPGRISEILIKEGDKVTKGQLLARIESPEIDAKMEQALAAKNAAISQLNKANAGARSEQIQAAYNKWQQAKAAADITEKTYERVSNLFKEKVIPEQKKDEAYAKSIAMREQERAAKSMYDMAKNGARSEDKQAAAALVERAKGAVNEISSYKKEANIVSPSSGEVQDIIPESGEVVNAGYPVVNLVDLTDIWVVLNIREDYLMKFTKDATFDVLIPALGNKKIQLQVKHIAALGDFATWAATKAQGDFDKKTFKIKAYPTEKVKGLRPGMTVLLEEAMIK